MNDALDSMLPLLTDVLLPNLKAVQISQSEQIAANDRLELAIDDLRTYMAAQFALLSAQLTACRAELAATQAALKAAQTQAGLTATGGKLLVH